MLWRRNSPKRSLIFLPETPSHLNLARRLHDGLAQELTSLGYRLDEIIGDSTLNQDVRDALRKIRLEFSSLSINFRDEIYRIRLMDRRFLREELAMALSEIEYSINLDYPPLTPEAEDVVGHSLLEIVRNSLQHSGATTVEISWKISKATLEISARDNGRGGVFEKERSFGIRGIQEWLGSINASHFLESDDSGTSIKILINADYIPSYTSLE